MVLTDSNIAMYTSELDLWVWLVLGGSDRGVCGADYHCPHAGHHELRQVRQSSINTPCGTFEIAYSLAITVAMSTHGYED